MSYMFKKVLNCKSPRFLVEDNSISSDFDYIDGHMLFVLYMHCTKYTDLSQHIRIENMPVNKYKFI